jgi:quercetin dioxygenase-like cupin family protein
MKAKQKIFVLILIGIIGSVTLVLSQMPHSHDGHIMVMPGDIKWADAPPSLPRGAKVAVIEGDPSAKGLFTLRAKIPANYKIMPHKHPADEHVTVMEGTCYMGLGEKFDEKDAMEMTTGAFAVMKTGTVHYFFTKKECIIQLHGMGPWDIIYINPADDPRKKKAN